MIPISRRTVALSALLAAAAFAPAALADSALKTVYIVAFVPDGTGTVYITGSDRALGPWNPHGAAMFKDGERRIYKMEAPNGMHFEYKFTLGSWKTEGLGEDGKPLTQNYQLVFGEKEIYVHHIPGFGASTMSH